MRYLWMLLLVGCGDVREPCDFYSPDDGCNSQESYAQCLEMGETCGRRVIVWESCPPQFACP